MGTAQTARHDRDLRAAHGCVRGPWLERALCVAWVLPLVACAHATPVSPSATSAAPPLPAPKPPLAHSSIAAVLAHRGELALTDEQIAKLEEMDRRLQSANEAIGAEGKVAGKPSPPPTREARTLPPSEERPIRDPTAGSGMGGRGLGRTGGRHRGAMGGSADSHAKRPDAEARMDDNDTQAYLDAESVLTEAQRPKARDIAEAYREQLYDWRRSRREKPGTQTGAPAPRPEGSP